MATNDNLTQENELGNIPLLTWATLPQKEVMPYYRQREYLTGPDLFTPDDNTAAQRIRYELSTRGTSFYPYKPDTWAEPMTDRRRKVQANRLAALHELIDELGEDDTRCLFNLATLFVKHPVNWAGYLAPAQQKHDRTTAAWLLGERVRLGL